MQSGFAVRGGGNRSTTLGICVPSSNLLRYLRGLLFPATPANRSEGKPKSAAAHRNVHCYTTQASCLCSHCRSPYRSYRQPLHQRENRRLPIASCCYDRELSSWPPILKDLRFWGRFRPVSLRKTYSPKSLPSSYTGIPRRVASSRSLPKSGKYRHDWYGKGFSKVHQLQPGKGLELPFITNGDTRETESEKTIPLYSALNPHQRQLRRAKETLVGIPSDNRWMRTCVWKLKNIGLRSGEAYWDVARRKGMDLEDLKKVSKVLMAEYNKAGLYVNTVRLFRWYEDAERIEARRKRTGRDSMKDMNVTEYLKSLDQRLTGPTGNLEQDINQENFKTEQAKVKSGVVERMIREIWELEAEERQSRNEEASMSQSRRREMFPKDKKEDIREYLWELRSTLLQGRNNLPPRFTSLLPSNTEDDLDCAIETWIRYGPPSSPYPGPRRVDTGSLNLVLVALLGLHDPDRAILLYQQYYFTVRFSPYTWEYVVQAHLQARKLSIAVGLLRFAKFRNQPVTHKTYILVLHAIKLEGGTWSKMVRYFKWLEGISKMRVPGIYHVMIQTAIERGMRDEANQYLQRMAAVGLDHTERSYGDLLGVLAKVRDWEGLKRTLALMDSKQYKLRVDSFNAILNAYAETADLAATEELFQSGIIRGVIPNVVTYNVMIKACVYAEGVADESFAYWLGRMVEDGIKPDNYTFNTLFQDLRKNYKASATLLRRVYARFRSMQRRMGIDQPSITYNITKIMLFKTAHEDNKNYKETYKVVQHDDSLVENRHYLALRMSSAIEARKPQLALSIWDDFIQKGRKPSLQIILLAFRASIISRDSHHSTESILELARKMGLEIPPIILAVHRQVTQKYVTDAAQKRLDNFFVIPEEERTSAKLESVYKKIEAVYQFLEKHRVPVTHHVCVHFANRLIDTGNHLAAIHLMHRVAQTKWGQRTPFEKYALSVLLKAYIRGRDTKGIQWVVDRLIASREKPTIGFYRLLRTYTNLYRKTDRAKRRFGFQLILKCRLHESRLEEEAKGKAKFLTEFMERALDPDQDNIESQSLLETGQCGMARILDNGLVINHKFPMDINHCQHQQSILAIYEHDQQRDGGDSGYEMDREEGTSDVYYGYNGNGDGENFSTGIR